MNKTMCVKQYVFQKVTIDQIKLFNITGFEYWNVDKDRFETHVTKIILRCQLNEHHLEDMIGKDIYYRHEKLEVFARINNIKILGTDIEIELLDFDCQ